MYYARGWFLKFRLKFISNTIIKIQCERTNICVYTIGYILYAQQKYRRKVLINGVDKYLKKLLLTNKKIGDPADMTTDLGSLVAERQLILLEAPVADALKKEA